MINALCYFLRYEYNRTTFLYVSEREEGWFYLKKNAKKRRKIQVSIQFIYLSITRFFKNLKESQENEFLPLRLGTISVCVRVCEDTAVSFFCFQLVFKLFPYKYSQPCHLAAQVSSGSAAWMRARLAWTKVLIQALVHCKEYSSVCACV